MNGNAHDCMRFDELLPDLMEGEFHATAAFAAEREARACPRCSALLSELGAIRREAASLPVLHPERDLWEGIAARIAPEVIPIGEAASAGGPAAPATAVRRYTHPAWLAAAAMLLVIVTATVTWFAVVEQQGAGTVVQGPSNEGMTTAGSFVIESVEEPYRDQIAMLRTLVDERRTDLDSATVAVIERNLQIIEEAVADSRAALARDTTSRFLRDQLNDALEQKVELLRTAALLPPSRT